MIGLQLLKRWRNVLYQNRADGGPPSVLLSRFAAEHAGTTESLSEELLHQAVAMREHFRLAENTGTLIRVSNPVCAQDVLTDRWPANRPQQREFLRDLERLIVATKWLLGDRDLGGRGCVVWEGTLQPLCKTYTVHVGLQHRRAEVESCAPFAIVVAPRLRHRPDAPEEPLPHIYDNPDPRLRDFPLLCLYHPPSGEWHGGMAVAATIVPWTIDWLVCYEGWLATGRWTGGGIH